MSTRGGVGGRRGGRADQGVGRGGGGRGGRGAGDLGAPRGGVGRGADRAPPPGATQRGGHAQAPQPAAPGAIQRGGHVQGPQPAAPGATQRGRHVQGPQPAAAPGRGGYSRPPPQGRGQQQVTAPAPVPTAPTPVEVEALRRQMERKMVVTDQAQAAPRQGSSSSQAPVQAPAAAARLLMQGKAAQVAPARPEMMPAKAAQAAPAGPAASSSSASAAAPAGTLPPASSRALALTPRPGYGTVGRRCKVRANHVQVQLQDKDIYHYDVVITPETTSRARNRWVINELVSFHRQHLDGRRPVYDGRKSLFTAGRLPFTSKEFVLRLTNPERASQGYAREKEYRVVIKDATQIDMYSLKMFLAGRSRELPQDTVQALDIALRETPTARHTPISRSFFSSQAFGIGGHLGNGVECWRGYYQSLRPTQMGLSLNIDISATAFYKAQPIIDFAIDYLNLHDTSKRLSDQDRIKLKKALRGVRIATTHQHGMSRRYKITGLTSAPLNELTFDQDGTRVLVVQYFKRQYNYSLKYTQWPCLQAGNGSKQIYLPMEVCSIVEGQRYSSKLNDEQVRKILKLACERPADREKRTLQVFQKNDYANDEYAKEFGIKVVNQLALVDARVLPAPRLKYHDSGREKVCNPSVGQWNMINKRMVNGGSIKYWACVTFTSRLNPNDAGMFCEDLASMCNNIGMQMNTRPCVEIKKAHRDHLEGTIRGIHANSAQVLAQQGLSGQQLQLLIIILPDISGSYGRIKRLCDTELGVITQCCAPKNVCKGGKQYLENLALKINVKVGGSNTVLEDALYRRIPLLTDLPTIVFGADVTHPSPGEGSSPSIAAVVASMDWPQVTKYKCLVSSQGHRDEIINSLYTEVRDPQKGIVRGGMVRDLLLSFYKSTGAKPSRIIFYRDGVSEGQFSQVLLYEMDAIRKGCASLEQGYLPKVTFVVVQKRHHTRLFAENHGARDQTDRSGNILPGTVVDTKICHPTEFDFYLCSHSGIQGTSRPAHYHVLFDENGFTADALQTLTYNLCYTYARCTRSVSIVPPAYYAHLGAFRARYYMEEDSFDQGSSSETSRTYDPSAQLPQIKGNAVVAGVGGAGARCTPTMYKFSSKTRTSTTMMYAAYSSALQKFIYVHTGGDHSGNDLTGQETDGSSTSSLACTSNTWTGGSQCMMEGRACSQQAFCRSLPKSLFSGVRTVFQTLSVPDNICTQRERVQGDISATAFSKAQPIMDFTRDYLNLHDTSKRLSDQDRIKLKKALRGARIATTHQRGMSRHYKIVSSRWPKGICCARRCLPYPHAASPLRQTRAAPPLRGARCASSPTRPMNLLLAGCFPAAPDAPPPRPGLLLHRPARPAMGTGLLLCPARPLGWLPYVDLDPLCTTRGARLFEVGLLRLGRSTCSRPRFLLRSVCSRTRFLHRQFPQLTVPSPLPPLHVFVTGASRAPLPQAMYVSISRSFFSTAFGHSGEIGNGAECWRGYYQSLRATQMGLSLNIDISATAFYKAQPILDFALEYLNIRDPSRRLSDQDRIKLKKALKGVRVVATHRHDISIRYRITGITSLPLNDLTFDQDGTMVSVVHYFKHQYNYDLKYIHWPCLQAGSDSRPTYLPMEVCKIVEGQRYSRKLNERQVTGILKLACERPTQRENSILEVVSRNNYGNDYGAKEFGIKVINQLALVDARVLPAPMLKYHDSGREKVCHPSIGQWNMNNKRLINGGSIKYWACVTFASRLHLNNVRMFCNNLVGECNDIGMQIHGRPCLDIGQARPDYLEATLRNIHRQAAEVLTKQGVTGQQLDLLIVVLPDANASVFYGRVKLLCETELGVMTQCCLPMKVQKGGQQYLRNLALKINVKVGGRNTVLEDALHRRIHLLTDLPTMVFGADVTHPSPGEDASPSIAAVVASMDWPEVSKYRCLVSSQGHREEIITDLFTQGSTKRTCSRELLVSFYRTNGSRKPARIIFYRDGVSEGQFNQVLLYEVDAIRKACASLEEGYLPPITFIVVQKRHHTRLFPENHRAQDQTDRSGNILPGTVVDMKICHPSEFDFYLCSHSGIQGTSRPTHYHVLYDENQFSADALQTLTYNLCYTYARCTRSVSIVPPAYYAHLAAFRARHYLDDGISDQGSSSAVGSRLHDHAAPVRQLPKVKENVKQFMFYC
ncbi:LOW QUALITY PROTEIN: hypothetical protein U9M48_010176 [Paspalum notatum var. saurae]|uniref:Uncharacterized protein n=1 Tax=Paspalum notatum var. saurae TaxID=547442 RepID=A0AAQ3WFV3_PASNO